MNCSDAQSQTAYSDLQGQPTLNDVLSHNFRPQAPENTAQKTGPYATAGGTSQMTDPYAAVGGTSQMTGPYATAGSTSQMTGPYATTGGISQQAGTYPTASQIYPITPTTEPMPMNVNSLQYLNGALRTQIGRKVTVSFLIGTSTYQDRTGTLLAVGANYIIINEVETTDLLFCDFYTIKFVKVYR